MPAHVFTPKGAANIRHGRSVSPRPICMPGGIVVLTEVEAAVVQRTHRNSLRRILTDAELALVALALGGEGDPLDIILKADPRAVVAAVAGLPAPE